MRGLPLVAASGGHSSSWCTGLSLSQSLLLRSTGSRRAGSVVVAHGLSCSTACGIFPDQVSNPCPLHWQADSQPVRHQGSPSNQFISEMECQHNMLLRFLISLLEFWTTLFFQNWSIVDLQYCVSFKCIVKWFTYIDMYICILGLFSIIGYNKILNVVPCAISIVCLFYVLWCVSINPILLIYPSPTPVPPW